MRLISTSKSSSVSNIFDRFKKTSILMKQTYICIFIELIQYNILIEDPDKSHACLELQIYKKKNQTKKNFGVVILQFLLQ